MLAAVTHDFNVLFVFLRQSRVPAHNLTEAENSIQRGAQLVTHVGQKGTLGQICPFSVYFRILQLQGSFRHLNLKLTASGFNRTYPPAEPPGKQPYGDRYHTDPEPHRFPPRRGHADADRGALLVPDPIIVGADRPEDIVPRVQVGIGGKTPRAVHLVPSLFETFQPVPESVLFRGSKVQCRKFKRDHPVPVGEHQLIGLKNRFLQNRIGSDGHRLVRQLKISN